jgi:hypothetical protein
MKQIKTPEKLQLAAAHIASRLRTDKNFKKSLFADPVSTLKKLGIGNDATRELIQEDAWARTHFLKGTLADDGCTVTCICSDSCCITCWIGSQTLTDKADLVSNPGIAVFGHGDKTLKVAPARANLLENLIASGHISSPE